MLTLKNVLTLCANLHYCWCCDYDFTMNNVAVILSRYIHLHYLFDSWPVYMHYLYRKIFIFIFIIQVTGLLYT